MMFAVALVSSFLLFFFVSESRHPFNTPNSSVKRKRWRYARQAACIHFISAVAGILCAQFLSMGFASGLLIFLIVTFLAHSVMFCVRRLGLFKTKSSSSKTNRQRDSSDNVEKLESTTQSNVEPVIASRYKNTKYTDNKQAQHVIKCEPAPQANKHSVKRDKKEGELLVEESEHITL